VKLPMCVLAILSAGTPLTIVESVAVAVAAPPPETATALICGEVALAATFTVASFAAFPDKPVKLLVGYAPGGSTDIVARLLANSLSARWGQPVVVENRPGASGMIAAEAIARARPDGYNLLLGYTPEVSLNKFVFKEMRYDPLTDLTPVALAASAPLVLVAGPKLAVSSFKELLARKNSGQQISYASPGIGGQQHMAGEMLARQTGLPLIHVPYRGTGLAVSDLVGGQIDLFFATPARLNPTSARTRVTLHSTFIAKPEFDRGIRNPETQFF